MKLNNVTANSVSNPINNTEAAGAPVIVNGLTVAQLKDGTSRFKHFSIKITDYPSM